MGKREDYGTIAQKDGVNSPHPSPKQKKKRDQGLGVAFSFKIMSQVVYTELITIRRKCLAAEAEAVCNSVSIAS